MKMGEEQDHGNQDKYKTMHEEELHGNQDRYEDGRRTRPRKSGQLRRAKNKTTDTIMGKTMREEQER